jgi:C-terminal processing protease CtpA/Prc
MKDLVYGVDGLTASELKDLKRNGPDRRKPKTAPQYEYRQLDSTTGLLSLRDFGITDEAKYYGFLDSVFRQLRDTSIGHLIIDARDNPGGGDDYGSEVIKYLYHRPFQAYSKSYYEKSKILEDFSYMFLYPEDRNNQEMRKAAINMGDCQAEHEYGT